jgi:hypothetical protein
MDSDRTIPKQLDTTILKADPGAQLCRTLSNLQRCNSFNGPRFSARTMGNGRRNKPSSAVSHMAMPDRLMETIDLKRRPAGCFETQFSQLLSAVE